MPRAAVPVARCLSSRDGRPHGRTRNGSLSILDRAGTRVLRKSKVIDHHVNPAAPVARSWVYTATIALVTSRQNTNSPVPSTGGASSATNCSALSHGSSQPGGSSSYGSRVSSIARSALPTSRSRRSFPLLLPPPLPGPEMTASVESLRRNRSPCRS